MASSIHTTVALAGVAIFIHGCDGCSEEQPAVQERPVLVSQAKPGEAECKIDPSRPGFMQRGGTAEVRLEGDGVSVQHTGVPALCGPLFNRAITALGVTAGQGLLLDTCLPEGTLQIVSWDRVGGTQPLHGMKREDQQTLQGGTEVSFNRDFGATYTSHGGADDRVQVSEDGFKAEAEVTLKAVDGSGALKASVSFDCTKGPPAVMPDWEVQAEPGKDAGGANVPAASKPSAPAPTDAP